jgi:hypothetical protein
MRYRELRVEPEEAVESVRAVEEISPDEVIISDRLVSYIKTKLHKEAIPRPLDQVLQEIRAEAATGEPSEGHAEPHNRFSAQPVELVVVDKG